MRLTAMPRLAWVVALVCAGLGRPGAVDAQSTAAPIEAPLSGSLTAGGGAMISADQRDLLGLDFVGFTARLGLWARPLDALGVDWLEGGLSVAFTLVGSSWTAAGGVLDVELAVRAAPDLGGGIRPWLALGMGPGWTGRITRAAGTVSAGVWLPIGGGLAMGPQLELLHVVQDDGPRFTDDALFLSGGAALMYRPTETPAPPPPPEPEPIAPPPPPIAVPPMPPREPAIVDHDELFYLMERAVPGSTLSVVMLVPPVIFDHDAAELDAAGQVAMHDVLERVLAADPTASIVIEGHADETGAVTYNLDLSRRRGETVAAWLAAHGVPAERMRVTAEGALRPLVVGDSIEALAPNRRVTIRIETRLTVPSEGEPVGAVTDDEPPPDVLPDVIEPSPPAGPPVSDVTEVEP